MMHCLKYIAGKGVHVRASLAQQKFEYARTMHCAILAWHMPRVSLNTRIKAPGILGSNGV